MKKFYTFVRGLIYVPVKILYPTKVLNRQNLPKTNQIITVSNHLRWLDIPVLAINVPGFRRFIAKKEIGKNKFIRKCALGLGVIFIDRNKADLHAIRESVNTLKSGGGISIFPEGTRNKSADGALQEVKGGVTMLALKGNAPIVPLILYRKERIFRKNYLYVGEPFRLDEFKGRLLDAETLAEASDTVAAHMQKAREDMEVFVREKRWKVQAKERKERNRLLRAQNKQAKKDYAALLRAEKAAHKG